MLGGEQLWIVADKGREWPGYPLTALVVQKELYDGGLRSIADLKGKRIGVTQIGSTFHYHIGNILEKDGLTPGDVEARAAAGACRPPMEALKGKQVDAILAAAAVPRRGGGAGLRQDHRLGRRRSIPWQIATDLLLDGSSRADRARAVAFMKGYVKASRYYFDAALVQKDGRVGAGPNYDEVVAITAKYTGATPGDHPHGLSLPGPRTAACCRATSSGRWPGGTPRRLHEDRRCP